MATLTREQILDADDLVREDVPVPEWGGSVLVRTISGTEREVLEALVTQSGAATVPNLRARLAVLTVVDAQGVQLFTDADIAALSEKSALALDRIFAVAQRLNGLADQDVEDLEKNSGGAPGADSTSD